MIYIGLLNFFNKFKSVSYLKLITEQGNGNFIWNGKVYESDAIRACIRPKVKAVGKLVGQHIREMVNKDGKRDIKVNPDVHIKFLLEEPNELMSGQKLQEKLATQLCLNNNAFALILRDEFGYAQGIFPIDATGCEAIYSKEGNLYLKFYLLNSKIATFKYSDIIHLRSDFYENDIFGTNMIAALEPLMNMIGTMDKGLINAIKNGGIIRWLLKYSHSIRREDIEANVKEFADAFMNVDNNLGVAGIDPKTEAVQVQPHDYVPNTMLVKETRTRLFEFFNTNLKIVNSSANEEEWSAYFDNEIEPVLIDLQNEYSRKIFSRKERSFGNRIYFSASAWDNASFKTKLSLKEMVDRGSLVPNEWRRAFNLPPIPGGDEPIRRLDTAPVQEIGDGSKGGDGE